MSLPKHVMRRASNLEYITQRESCLLYCKRSCSAPLQQTRHGLADHLVELTGIIGRPRDHGKRAIIFGLASPTLHTTNTLGNTAKT